MNQKTTLLIFFALGAMTGIVITATVLPAAPQREIALWCLGFTVLGLMAAQHFLRRATTEPHISYDYEGPEAATNIWDDPEFANLRRLFLGGLEKRINEILVAFESQDAGRLEHLVHKLAGAAATYDCSAISQKCQRIEFMLRQEAGIEGVRSNVEELVALLREMSAQ